MVECLNGGTRCQTVRCDQQKIPLLLIVQLIFRHMTLDRKAAACFRWCRKRLITRVEEKRIGNSLEWKVGGWFELQSNSCILKKVPVWSKGDYEVGRR